MPTRRIKGIFIYILFRFHCNPPEFHKTLLTSARCASLIHCWNAPMWSAFLTSNNSSTDISIDFQSWRIGKKSGQVKNYSYEVLVRSLLHQRRQREIIYLLWTLHHIFDQQCTMPGDVVDPRWVRSQLSIHQPTPNHPFTIISFIHAHANSSIITLIITVNYIFIHCVCYSLILQRLYYIYIYPHGRRGRTTAVHVAVSGWLQQSSRNGRWRRSGQMNRQR